MGRGVGPSPSGEGLHRSSTEGVPATVITSRRNPLIQDLRALRQSPARRTARCVVEGWRFLDTAVAGGAEVHLVVYTPAAAADPRGEEIHRRLREAGVQLVLVSPYVFESLTQVDAPQGVLGVVRRPPDASPAVLRETKALLAVLDGVQDPGNVGAILRTAAGFAVNAVITTARHSPEATGVLAKSASGALEYVPMVTVQNLARALAALRERGYLLVGLDSTGDVDLGDAALRAPLALVLGAEGKGLRQLTRATCDQVARLDLPGRIKSLNVSNAAALALYIVTKRTG